MRVRLKLLFPETLDFGVSFFLGGTDEKKLWWFIVVKPDVLLVFRLWRQ